MKLKLLIFGLLFVFLLSLCACSVPAGAGQDAAQPSTEETNAMEQKPISSPFDDGKPYETVKISVEIDGMTIVGKAFIPKNAEGPLPAVICSHGYNNTMVNMQSYATELAKDGFVTVIFDFRGGGKASSSDGESTQMSVLTEEADLKAVFDYVKAMEEVDETRMYLLGCSQGGLISGMAAADLGDDAVKAIVLLYPALVAADDAREAYASIDEVPETVDFMGLTISRAYYEALLTYDPYEDITRYTGDVLILHGTADTTVPYAYGVRASEEYENAELVTYEGQGHGFNGQAANDSLEVIREYLMDHAQ